MWRKILKIEIWAQERQTIPRAFVYEQSVEGEHFTYSPQASVFVLSMCAHIYAYKFVCVLFYLVGFTSVLTDQKWTLSDVFNRDILFYESCKITLKSNNHLFFYSVDCIRTLCKWLKHPWLFWWSIWTYSCFWVWHFAIMFVVL